MFVNYFISLFLGALILLPSTLNAATETRAKLTLSYEDKQNFPFYMGNGASVTMENPGVSIEMLRLVEKEVPVEISFVRMPWKRCKSALQQSQTDGIFNASFTTERMKIGAYPMKNGEIDSSRRITTISYFLYKNKSTPIQWDDDSKKILHLKGKVCAPLGYSIVNNLKNWGIPVIEKTRCYDCFALVSLKNPLVSCVATLEFDGDSYLHIDDNRIKNIEKVNPPLIRKPYYLMLSHQFVRIHPALAEKIWDTIAIIRENEFNKIMEKYL